MQVARQKRQALFGMHGVAVEANARAELADTAWISIEDYYVSVCHHAQDSPGSITVRWQTDILLVKHLHDEMFRLSQGDEKAKPGVPPIRGKWLCMMTSQATRTVCCLVRANLGTCFIHAGLAKSQFDAGKRGPAERSFELARSSHDAMVRFVEKVEDQAQRDEIQIKLVHLRHKLDFLQWQLNPKPA
jgi:hypothetical protein